MKLFLVGGTVRDYLISNQSKPSKDIDFAVEAPDFHTMVGHLCDDYQYTHYQSREQFGATRGSIPLDKVQNKFGVFLAKHEGPSVPADFTLCRSDGHYTDQRHPDTITPTDIKTDLSRRDFTMNAIAVSEEGRIIDPYGGTRDIQDKRISTVGDPNERFKEDPLRMLRAVRFAITLPGDFNIEDGTGEAIIQNSFLIETVSEDRIREEFNKMLSHNWLETVAILSIVFTELVKHIKHAYPKLWLRCTSESR